MKLLDRIFKKKFPLTIEESDHHFTRDSIEREVANVLKRLQSRGYSAYLVGGCIRDVLLGLTAKDFDIVTDARPRQVKRLFRKCFLIGRRFRLAHVYISRDRFVEVATFRAQVDPEDAESSRFGPNNIFGSIEEDAFRRDFTINSLYYDISDRSIVDYTGGMNDLQRRIIRSIGDPEERFQEDPVRIIRAARFCAQLDFRLSRKDFHAAKKCAPLIAEANNSRLYEELNKIFRSIASADIFLYMRRFGVLTYWLPFIDAKKKESPVIKRLSLLDGKRKAGEEPPSWLYLVSLFFDLFEKAVTERGPSHSFQDNFEFLKDEFKQLATDMRISRLEWNKVCANAARQWTFSDLENTKNRRRIENRFLKSSHYREAYQLLTFLVDADMRPVTVKEYWDKRDKELRETQQNRNRGQHNPSDSREKNKKRKPAKHSRKSSSKNVSRPKDS